MDLGPVKSVLIREVSRFQWIYIVWWEAGHLSTDLKVIDDVHMDSELDFSL